ncbi:MAG: RNA-binding cell elongation regulator Jag/EloR [Actinomycetota bacterium]
MQEIERSAQSVEEALEAALAALGAKEQEVDVEIVQEPKGGFLRRGGQEAIVRVRRRRNPSAPTQDELEEQGEIAADFLDELLEHMGIDAAVEPNFEDGTMYVDILGDSPDDEEMAILIGRHGLTLESLQELTRVVVGRQSEGRCRVMVDVEDYRKRQRDRLESRARDLSKQVLQSGKERELEAMNAYDRKLVHDVVSGFDGLESSSRGEDPERRVVIRKA